MLRPTSLLLAMSALLAACATAPDTPPFPPPPVVRAKAYEGPTLPEREVATVFILDGRPRYESGYICEINGKPATAQGGCASVVYLRPGVYQLLIKYQSPREVGKGAIGLWVEAGRLYQLNATSFRISNRGVINLMPMPAGTKLTYRNVAPGLFSGSKADEPIAYGEQ